ncbi:hypothetical protein VB715_18595 [Crocosphaera sp. UHCC 0190]|uniref:hypothetical protein n=1 Tax=Crocosphaera sp. UHCC 0190 TaxID=3110246 RepID=UPI002B20A4A9|nr:hypothetical protein [Crocosphaera sp. UHCC 0190]MEA5511785.1 hypothetical protein [Crocosphaera sp. UHCC 0190]
MTNNETRQILKIALSELRKIQEDPNHLNVDQAQDLFRAIESLESLNNDFQLITGADIAVVDQLLNCRK